MAITIPIWPGSSSFSAGQTQFFFFDSDTSFQTDADRVASWCATRLGYPLSDVELQDKHFYACFEEAVLEYSNQVNQFSIRDNMFQLQGTPTGSSLTGKPIEPHLGRLVGLSKHYGTEAGSGGYLTYKTASMDIVEGKQVYNIPDFSFELATDSTKDIEVRKVFHFQSPAIVRYFDPFVGTGLGSQQLLENFGWGSYSPGVSFLMMPIYADLLRLQAIEFNDLVRRSGYSFEITGDRFRIFPIPTYDFKLFIQYTTVEDRSTLNTTIADNLVGDFSNAPYSLHQYRNINPAGRQWIYKYTLALSKEVLGNVRSKYGSIPIPGAEVTLNGTELVSQGQTEQTELITQLRENLEAVSRQTQLAKQAEEAENIQLHLNKVPLPIYIG